MLCGLEVVRTLNDRGLATKRGIEVICWTNEEGARFSPPMMGSMAFAKVLSLDSVLATTDDAGITVEQALDSIGYAGPAPLGQRAFDSYLELHIEQAPVLDREGCDIGIVVGGYRTQALRLTLNGDTGHAGGTPMAMRRNALVGAGYVIAAVNDIGLAFAADEGRTTTTRIESFPNLPGTYAEQVKLTIDYRHIDPERFQAMRTEIDAAIAAAGRKANVEIEVAEGWSWGTDLFAPECIELLKSTAEELGLPYREMRSQAGHDAYAVATMAPTAMIFTPCFEGISHNVNEAIELARSVPGANLLLNAAVHPGEPVGHISIRWTQVFAGGAPLQWRVMLFRTAGVPPAPDHQRAGGSRSTRARNDALGLPASEAVPRGCNLIWSADLQVRSSS